MKRTRGSKKKLAGRPRIAPGKRRTALVKVLVTPREKAMMEKAAALYDLSLSAWARAVTVDTAKSTLAEERSKS